MQKAYQAGSNRKNILRKLLGTSLILSALSYLSARLAQLISKSRLAGFFTSSGSADEARRNGLLSAVSKKLRLHSIVSSAKTAFASSVEASIAVRLYRRLVRGFFATTIRTVGVFLLSSGLYAALAYAIEVFVTRDAVYSQTTFVTIVIMLLCAALMLLSGKSVGKKLCESVFFGFVIFGILGINRLSVDTESEPENHYAVAFFAGLAFGVGCFFTGPLMLIGAMLTAVTALTVMYSPESGICISLAVAAVAGREALFPILALTLVSYFLKLLRGKRNLNLKSEDVIALLFAFVFLIAYPVGSESYRLLCVLAYFMTVNLMRSVSLMDNAVNSIALGLMISTYARTAGIISAMTGFDFALFTGINLDVLNMTDLITVAAIPFALHIARRRESSVHRSFTPAARWLFLAAALFNAMMSFSDKVWLYSAICAFFYIVYRTEKLFNTLFCFLLASPLVFFARNIAFIYSDVAPVGIASPFSADAPWQTLLFGGGDTAAPSLYGSFISAFGIAGCTLALIFLFFLLARAFTVREMGNRTLNGQLSVFLTMLAVFMVAGLSDNTLSAEGQVFIFWVTCGLISASGNAAPRTGEYMEGQLC